ncbi:MaoC family dehydratase [Kitasatospora cineracea]|uniref:MaoC family dehydratase n=1 Tax=Kitasatospora cineracea TaxID=88074 RepID=UPI0034304C8E
MPTHVHTMDELKDLAGLDLGRTGWLPVDQDRIDTFADATDDHQWIHVDPEKAAAGPFRGTIAHGYLTLSLLIPLFLELLEVKGAGMAVNYGLNKVRFPAPVRTGQRIRLAARIASVTDVPKGLELALDFTVEVEDGPKPACVAQALYRFYR